MEHFTIKPIPSNASLRTNSEFLMKLKNIYSAEYHCHRRIPELLNKIPKTKLYFLLNSHIQIIAERMFIIENIFREIGENASGMACMTFKKLINKTANVIYQVKSHQTRDPFVLINALVEISIYRCSIYNYLQQALVNFDNSYINAALNRCLAEEDNFFYSLMKFKEEFSRMNPITDDSVMS